jgi:hypothetical protein
MGQLLLGGKACLVCKNVEPGLSEPLIRSAKPNPIPAEAAIAPVISSACSGNRALGVLSFEL